MITGPGLQLPHSLAVLHVLCILMRNVEVWKSASFLRTICGKPPFGPGLFPCSVSSARSGPQGVKASAAQVTCWPAGQVGAWLEQGWSGPRTLTGRSHMNTRTSSRHVQQTIKRKASPSTRRPAKSSTVLYCGLGVNNCTPSKVLTRAFCMVSEWRSTDKGCNYLSKDHSSTALLLLQACNRGSASCDAMQKTLDVRHGLPPSLLVRLPSLGPRDEAIKMVES
jgi:hypothetical protein